MIGFLRRAKTQDPGSAGERGRRGRSLMYFLWPAFGLTLISVTSGWYLASLIRDRTDSRAELALAQGVGKLFVADLGAFLGQVRRTLVNAAQDPRTLESLDASAQHPDSALGEFLGRALPAFWVRLMPAGWEQPDTSVKPPMGYASIELARRAEHTGQPTPFEVDQPGTSEAHIAIAVPVSRPGGGAVVGTIHAALSPEWVHDALANVQPETGVSLSLRQRLAGGGVRVLAGASDAADVDSPSLPVPGTIWEVGYRATAPGRSGSDSLVFWLLPLVVSAVIVLVVIWQLRRVSRALQEDLGALADMVEAAVSGRPPVRPIPLIAESEALIARLDSVLRARAAPAVSVTPAPATGEPRQRPVVPEAGQPESDVALGRVKAPAPGSPAGPLPAAIFNAYDIRGVAGETLTPAVMTLLGRAIGSEAYDRGQQTVIVGRDCRESGPELAEAMVQGLRSSGRDVVDLGMVPTPLLYFATRFLGSDCGVMVTGSHNPPEYNGVKLVLGGETVSGDQIQALTGRLDRGELLQGEGSYRSQDLLADYVDRVASDVRLARPMKVVVDCGNGAAGLLAPVLLRTLGCEVVELYCNPDGRFPNHQPDPSRPENLADLSAAVQREAADLGIAFDGDGDRLGVVDNQGKIIWPDRLLMLFAQDVLSRQPGADIIYDVKSSRELASYILLHGGRPLMWKSGHSLMRAKLKETGALLAGELSGHVFFEERWYGFDDGPYAGARLLEILAEDPRPPAEVFAELPESPSTPELLVPTADGAQHALAARMIAMADLKGATLTTIDGLRAEFAKGWGLVRASNTTPHLVFRFEADDAESLAEIESQFRKLALSVDPNLQLPF